MQKNKISESELQHTMTKLTNDTAFNDISQTYISPSKLTMITATVKVTINAILKLNPRRRKVTTNMAAERKNRKGHYSYDYFFSILTPIPKIRSLNYSKPPITRTRGVRVGSSYGNKF